MPGAVGRSNGADRRLIKLLSRLGSLTHPLRTSSGTVRCAVDLSFNLLIALGLSLTHPLLISLGTLLSTPLNLAVEAAAQQAPPSAVAALGIGAICFGTPTATTLFH